VGSGKFVNQDTLVANKYPERLGPEQTQVITNYQTDRFRTA